MKMNERIRYLRESIDMTQEELGEALGVQKSAVAKYESGRVENIKRSTIKRMAELFGVSPCYLLGFDDDTEAVQAIADQVALLQAVQDQWGKDAVQALSMLNDLNPEGRKKALDQLEDLTSISKYRKEVSE